MRSTSMALSSPCRSRNLKAHAKLSKKAGKIWREYGTLDYREWVADDVKAGHSDFVSAERRS